MEKLIRSLHNKKNYLENLKNQLNKKDEIVIESSLRNISKYIRIIESIAQICES